MANTPYNQPDAGSTDWHIPLNENFQDIGTDVDNNESNINQLISDMNAVEDALTTKADVGHSHSGETISPATTETNELAGGLLDRSEPITHLAGNIYVSETDPATETTMATGDLWIEVS